MVAVDASALIFFLNAKAGTPVGRNGKPITRAAERIAQLIARMDAAKHTLVVPAPALAEVLVRVHQHESRQAIVDQLRRHRCFRIEPFGDKAAVETALIAAQDLQVVPRKGRLVAREQSIAKVKYDRQIVAIAKVSRCDVIYSDDADLRVVAERMKLTARSIGDIELSEQVDAFDAPR